MTTPHHNIEAEQANERSRVKVYEHLSAVRGKSV
jgi:hypothetical protein